MRASQALVTTKDAFELLVLTAARSGEVRLATWDEMDLDAAVWTIPAARMKAKRDHRVPLSGRALAILHDARRRSDGTGLVFRSPRGKPLSDMTLSKLIKELGIAAVPHGFRSSFRDWAAERTNTPREVVEAALAHTVRNPTEAAYARSDLFERRRRLMHNWAAYLSGERGARGGMTSATGFAVGDDCAHLVTGQVDRGHVFVWKPVAWVNAKMACCCASDPEPCACEIPQRKQAKVKVERKICCARKVSRDQRGRACPATPLTPPRGARPGGPSGFLRRCRTLI